MGTPKSVQPLVAAAAMPARVHAARVRDYDRLRRAWILQRLLHYGAASALRPTQKPVLKVRALRHLVHEGEGGPSRWTYVARVYSPDNLMPLADRVGCNLTIIGPRPSRNEAGPNPGQPDTAQASARDCRPDLVGRSSLGETLNRPQDAVSRLPLRLNSDIPADRHSKRRARAPVGA